MKFFVADEGVEGDGAGAELADDFLQGAGVFLQRLHGGLGLGGFGELGVQIVEEFAPGLIGEFELRGEIGEMLFLTGSARRLGEESGAFIGDGGDAGGVFVVLAAELFWHSEILLYRAPRMTAFLLK